MEINVGIAGLGFIGLAHIEALKRVPNVSIRGVVDINDELAKKKAKEYNIKNIYKTYDEMLDDQSIHAVHICTTNSLHAEMVEKALLKNKHILCEKPLCLNIEEANKIKLLAEKNQKIFAINYCLRFYPLVQEVKALINKGEIGNIIAVHGSYMQDWLFYKTDFNWRLESKQGGNTRALSDLGTHWIDMIEHITNLKVEEVICDFLTYHKQREKPKNQVESFKNKEETTGIGVTREGIELVNVDTEDYLNAMFRFNKDVKGALVVSQISAGRKNRLFFEINGDKKSLIWDSENPNILQVGNRNDYNHIIMKDPSLMSQEAKKFASYPGGHAEGYPDVLKQFFIDFYNKVEDKNYIESFPSLNEGIREMLICEKMLESSKKDKWIKI